MEAVWGARASVAAGAVTSEAQAPRRMTPANIVKRVTVRAFVGLSMVSVSLERGLDRDWLTWPERGDGLFRVRSCSTSQILTAWRETLKQC